MFYLEYINQFSCGGLTRSHPDAVIGVIKYASSESWKILKAKFIKSKTSNRGKGSADAFNRSFYPGRPPLFCGKGGLSTDRRSVHPFVTLERKGSL